MEENYSSSMTGCSRFPVRPAGRAKVKRQARQIETEIEKDMGVRINHCARVVRLAAASRPVGWILRNRNGQVGGGGGGNQFICPVGS